MPGSLALTELETLIRNEEVDTVLTVCPDMQGRLMGKRVVGRYFLEQVAHYLLAARLEQEAFDRAVTHWELQRNFERI